MLTITNNDSAFDQKVSNLHTFMIHSIQEQLESKDQSAVDAGGGDKERTF